MSSYRLRKIFNTSLSLVVVFAFVFSPLTGIVSFTPKAVYANGATEVGNCHDLHSMMNAEGGLAADYLLTGNLDCTDDGLLAENPETELTGNDFLFGDFSGSLDGDGNSITVEFTVENSGLVGLFERITGDASVTNLTLNGDVRVSNGGEFSIENFGILAGEILNGATISQVTVTGDLQITILTDNLFPAIRYAGLVAGSAGYSNTTIDELAVDGSVTIVFDPEEEVDGSGVEYIGGAFGTATCGMPITNSSANIIISMDDGLYGDGVGGFVGLSMCEGPGAELNDVHVTGVIHAGAGVDRVGGIIGDMRGGSITDSSFTGTAEDGPSVFGDDRVGGLVGRADNDAEIINSHTSGDVSGDSDYVGGLVGQLRSSTVSGSYATGDVSGDQYIGGLVGDMRETSVVSSSYSTGDVSGTFIIGGFVGSNSESEIDRAYALGEVTGEVLVGGFIGVNEGVISNTYSRGSVEGTDDWIGGFTGLNFGQIFYSYTTSNVIADNDPAGGFAGDNGWDTIYSSFSVGTIAVANPGDTPRVGGFIGVDSLSHYNSGWWTGAYDGPAIGRIEGQDDSAVDEIAWNEDSVSAFKNMQHGLYTTTSGNMDEGYDGEEFFSWNFEDVWGINPDENDGYPFLLFQGLTHNPGESDDDPDPILGCTDSAANNYNSSATEDNGSCTYSSGGGSSSSGSRSGGRSSVVQQPTQTIEGIVNQYRDVLLQAHGMGISLPPNILNLLGIQAPSLPVRDLEYGMEGDDVRALQTLLIGQGYPIPAGATSFFLSQTQSALAAYQAANSISPAAGYFGPITRAFMKTAGLTGLWW